jgi:hypothetical protein
MTIAADVPTNQRQRRRTIYEQHLHELVRLLNAKPGLYGWEIWNYFAAKRQLSRREVTELIARAKEDRWIEVSDFGNYFVLAQAGRYD